MTSMFEFLKPAPPDAILGLSEAFQADPSPAKINLAVGVFKDAAGQTPVLDCVKRAERWLVETETTKTYLGIDGLPEYRARARELVFGDAVAAERIAMVQTPGGTGGVRVAADFLASHLPRATVWVSNPTWENHVNIFAAAGLPTETYRYLNAAKTGLDFQALLDDLEGKASPGDVVLLHACCHNPTGVDLAPAQWTELAALIARRGLLPLVDFAYQGFGDGLHEDALGLRTLLAVCGELIVANSFSKNFGLYSERVGTAAVVTRDATTAVAALSQLKRAVRSNYSNPPRHGAAVVAAILGDPELNQLWREELNGMRQRIAGTRRQLVEALRDSGAGRDFSFLLDQKGMFSYTGLTPMQCDRLRSQFSIYIVGSGRINVAGVTPGNLTRLTQSIIQVL